MILSNPPAWLCAFVSVALTVTACGRSPPGSSAGRPAAPPATTQTRTTARPPAVTAAEVATAAPGGAPPAQPVDTGPYPWHADRSLDVLPAVDHLEDRIAPPRGFTRVPLEAGSFGAWLRRLPLAAADQPVRTYRGGVLHRAGHPNVAAVSTLDIGAADLQQCADAVMRLHAEWSWCQGRRDMSYRAAAGTPLPYARWARGERLRLDGDSLRWEPSGRPNTDHAGFRRYLDAVFSWANTVSLARHAARVDLAELRPGDFMILPGNPGHAVLILDLAESADGRRAVLLGQSYMPAQSFHVLRPSRTHTWFAIEPNEVGIQTPFWPAPFPWSSLRRLD